MSKATSMDNLEEILSNYVVKIERKSEAKHYGKYFTYVLADTSGFASEDGIPKNY